MQHYFTKQKFWVTLFTLLWAGTLMATSFNTITIDGTNDFDADEDVAGTSSSTWYFTWDANNFYFAVDASDVNSGDANKWVHLYIDTDPNGTITGGTGSTTGVTYNTQTPSLPFSANYHFRWRTDNGFTSLEVFNSGWGVGNNTGIAAFQSGTFVEFSIPKANFGSPDAIHVCGAMINETNLSEFTFFMTPSSNSEGYNTSYTSWFGFRIGDTGVSPDAPANLNVNLPVELSKFTARNAGTTVQLDWATDSEQDNSHFEVERSTDSRSWEVIGEVLGQGESFQRIDYAFIDKAPQDGVNYYRLRQVDFNGTYAYSSVEAVELQQSPQVDVFPNPVSDIVYIQGAMDRTYRVGLYDLQGRLLVEDWNAQRLDLSAYRIGAYVLIIRDETGQQIQEEILLKQ